MEELSRDPTNLARDVVAYVDLFVVQQHTVDSLDSGLRSLRSFVVNETVSLGAAMLIGGNLARQDISECGKSIVKSLDEVNTLLHNGKRANRPYCRYARPDS